MDRMELATTVPLDDGDGDGHRLGGLFVDPPPDRYDGAGPERARGVVRVGMAAGAFEIARTSPARKDTPRTKPAAPRMRLPLPVKSESNKTHTARTNTSEKPLPNRPRRIDTGGGGIDVALAGRGWGGGGRGLGWVDLETVGLGAVAGLPPTPTSRVLGAVVMVP